jgi:hypothetical protein
MYTHHTFMKYIQIFIGVKNFQCASMARVKRWRSIRSCSFLVSTLPPRVRECSGRRDGAPVVGSIGDGVILRQGCCR